MGYKLTTLLLLVAVNLAAQSHPPSVLNPAQYETPILFTGLPSVIELPQGNLIPSITNENNQLECKYLILLPYAGNFQNVHLTSSGLGAVTFTTGGSMVPNQIALPNIGPDGTKVTFCMRRDLILQPASSVQGKLIVFAPGFKPVTAGIKLERPTLAPSVKAMEWFFAILIPVLIAAVVGAGGSWLTNNLTQRRDQKEAFRKFKDEKWDDLADFFQMHLRNVLRECNDEQEFAARVQRELQSRGYWINIPWKERDRIERFIKRQQADRMKAVLTIVFAEWSKAISELHL